MYNHNLANLELVAKIINSINFKKRTTKFIRCTDSKEDEKLGKMKIGVVGASGYVGGAVLRLLVVHPKVELSMHNIEAKSWRICTSYSSKFERFH